MLKKKAIILAAGQGKRLYPVTAKKPKCMLKVCGKPILQHQIEAFFDAGIEKIIITVGYMSESVKAFLRKYDPQKLKIVENRDFATTNNMYSLWLAKDEALSSGELILCNGDVVFDKGIIPRFIGSCPDCIVCDEGKYNRESMKVTLDDDGFINNISKNIPQKMAFGTSIDIYCFSGRSSKIFFSEVERTILKEKKANEWTEVALQKLLSDGKLVMKPFLLSKKEKWVEIDCTEDLLFADRIFSKLFTKLKNKKLFFIDLDGTVCLGNQIIPGADEFISKLKLKGIKHFLISNNSSKSKRDYVDKLRRMNIIVDETNIVLSSDAVKAFLKGKGIKDIYLVGSNSMCQDFLEAGFNIGASKPDYVVLGYDTEINYQKICCAAGCLNRGVPFIATHKDIVCPTPEGPVPDIGSMIAMFRKATNVEPVVFGKPRPEMIDYLIDASGVDRVEVVVVGDRLYTDQKLAANCQVDFICVLSGETKREDIEELDNFPDLIVNKISDLIPLL